jgi:hypothetical protein
MAAIQFFDTKDFEFKDISVAIGGANVTRLRGIKYKTSMEKEHLHGAGDEPLSIQSGNRMYAGTLEITAIALRDLNAAAIAAGGRDALDLKFDVVVSYRSAVNRPLMLRTIVGVELEEFEEGMTQGEKFSTISLPFKALKII